MIRLKTKEDIRKMRRAGILLRDLLLKLSEKIVPGVKTAQLDRFAEEYLKRNGGIPAFKGYRGYPASICVSVNDEVVHGIPGSREIREGDIVSIDVGVYYDGVFCDSAITVPCGRVTPEAEKLIEVTREALIRGIKVAKIGNRVGDISHTIQEFVESNGFNVIREFVGHGIGYDLHEDPPVPNFGKKGEGYMLSEGMTVAIEPMVSAGDWRVKIDGNGWTARTVDGSLSAHFEHTVAITSDGPIVLTG